MLVAIGIITIIFGVVCILWVYKNLKVREGLIIKAFSWPKGYVKWIIWPMGLALIYAGIQMIIVCR